MKLKNILVNWSYADEELLEPYEWSDDDDLESIESVNLYKISKNQMYDMYYSQMHCMTDFEDKVVTFCDEHIVLVVEFDEDNQIFARSLVTYSDQLKIIDFIAKDSVVNIDYEVIEESYNKELGLTRFEREKKQFVTDEIEYLYLKSQKLFSKIYFEIFGHFEDSSEKMYQNIMKRIEKGYNSIHELLYKELIKR